jgi:hypothetical protein
MWIFLLAACLVTNASILEKVKQTLSEDAMAIDAAAHKAANAIESNIASAAAGVTSKVHQVGEVASEKLGQASISMKTGADVVKEEFRTASNYIAEAFEATKDKVKEKVDEISIEL